MMGRRVLVVWIVAAALGLTAVAGAQTKPMTPEEMHRLHQNPAEYIKMLEDPARDAYQKPHDVLMALGLKDGERIADIGAGSGYFTLRFASHIGNAGRVYAVDINPDMIIHLNQRIRQAGLDNVRTILALPDDPLLPDASVNRFFICETWHHIENHERYLELMKKMLRHGGQVVVIDFEKKPLPVGPPDEMKIARDEVVREFQAHGYRLSAEPKILPYQYFLVFTPAPPSRSPETAVPSVGLSKVSAMLHAGKDARCRRLALR